MYGVLDKWRFCDPYICRLTNVDQSLTKVYRMRLLITKGGNKIWRTNQAKLKYIGFGGL